jgi:hypothetical protein
MIAKLVKGYHNQRRLFQKRVMPSKLDIYLFISTILHVYRANHALTALIHHDR